MERVDESEIVPNVQVLVSIVGQEMEEKVPPKPLILTPPEKSLTTAFCWDLTGSFFCVRVPDIISKLKNKKTASRNKISIKFYIPQWTVDNTRKKNRDTVPEKARGVFLCYI